MSQQADRGGRPLLPVRLEFLAFLATLLLGFGCIFGTAYIAARPKPSWQVDGDMLSRLDIAYEREAPDQLLAPFRSELETPAPWNLTPVGTPVVVPPVILGATATSRAASPSPTTAPAVASPVPPSAEPPTATPRPTDTEPPLPTPTATETPPPTATATPSPTLTPSPTSTPTSTPVPPTETPVPTAPPPEPTPIPPATLPPRTPPPPPPPTRPPSP